MKAGDLLAPSRRGVRWGAAAGATFAGTPVPGLPPAQPHLTRPAPSRLFLVGLLAVAGATIAAVMASALSPALAVLPVAAVTVAWVASRVPLRWSATALLLLLLVPDDRVETVGQWRSPLAVIGDVIHYRLDAIAGVPGLAVTGMEVILGLLLVVWLRRRVAGAAIDEAGQVPAAAPLRTFVLLYVAGVLLAEGFGLARGLPAVPWKLRNLLHPIALALLFLAAFRGPRDHRLLGRVVVFAAAFKAALALVVQRIAVVETGGMYDWATSHGDSVLASVALFLVLGDAVAHPTRRRLLQATLISALLLDGAVANNRRIFWVMVILTLVVAYAVSPMRGWKLGLTRFLVVAAPVVALYVAVGWNRSGAPFGPVQTLRGIVDSSVNRSSYWREVEDWNIAMSIRQVTWTGTGLGGQYTEIMPNDDISGSYKEYREWPHNNFLGLLLLLGPFGFTAVSALSGLVVFLAFRSFRRATHVDDKVAAFGCLAAVVACHAMSWGDLGSHFPQYKVFMALAIAVAARLAVATGAWPARRAGVGAAHPGR